MIIFDYSLQNHLLRTRDNDMRSPVSNMFTIQEHQIRLLFRKYLIVYPTTALRSNYNP